VVSHACLTGAMDDRNASVRPGCGRSPWDSGGPLTTPIGMKTTSFNDSSTKGSIGMGYVPSGR